MPLPPDHPLRYQLVHELHARPSPRLRAPCHAVFLAIKKPRDAANRDREEDRRHLIELLDRFGANHPPAGASHYYGQVGKYHLRWECYTEFVTYTIFVDGVAERPFDPDAYDVFPADWVAKAPGLTLTAALVRVEPWADPEPPDEERIRSWFSPDALCFSRVNDDSAFIATDFMIDPTGSIRFAVFSRPHISERRLGRIVQRILELEAYKSMALLGLPRAKEVARRINRLDVVLAREVQAMNDPQTPSEETLDRLLDIASEIEEQVSGTAYRFGASEAYAQIMRERIELLREERIEGRMTIREFMTRRFEPAMRTISSAAERLEQLAVRAKRAGDHLRTRVDVERTEQNQKLLASMDRRVALQLRLQHTVEGFSIIALSYYAVNLVTYALYPFAKDFGVDKAWLTATAVPPTVLFVWWVIRSIRIRLEKGERRGRPLDLDF